jgi:hypothetical protein
MEIPSPGALRARNFIPPRNSGEGGPRVCAVGGASAEGLFPALHAPSTTLRVFPSPAPFHFAGADKRKSFSRRDAPELCLIRCVPPEKPRGAKRRKAQFLLVRAHTGTCRHMPMLGARSPSGARRGTRQTGRNRLTQLQNHVSWNGAGAGVLPASGLSSPAGSPPTGPFAGRVVPQSRPGTGYPADVHAKIL